MKMEHVCPNWSRIFICNTIWSDFIIHDTFMTKSRYNYAQRTYEVSNRFHIWHVWKFSTIVLPLIFCSHISLKHSWIQKDFLGSKCYFDVLVSHCRCKNTNFFKCVLKENVNKNLHRYENNIKLLIRLAIH